MHGIIFSELRNYAEHYGFGWKTLLSKAGLENRVYLPLQEYPDAEIVALFLAASTLSGRSVAAVLEDFGEFMLPALMSMHGHLLSPRWKTIEIISHAQESIHKIVRVQDLKAKSPLLSTQRLGPDEVLLLYTSPRKLCALAVGIAKGLAKRFHENIVIQHKTCMHKDAPRCEIVFRRIYEGRTVEALKKRLQGKI